jgi:hypothetical protein
LTIAAVIVVIIRTGPGTPSPAPGFTIAPVVDAARMYGVGWILLSLLLAWVSVKLSMRLAS